VTDRLGALNTRSTGAGDTAARLAAVFSATSASSTRSAPGYVPWVDDGRHCETFHNDSRRA
jgi:hypothetical protein